MVQAFRVGPPLTPTRQLRPIRSLPAPPARC